MDCDFPLTKYYCTAAYFIFTVGASVVVWNMMIIGCMVVIRFLYMLQCYLYNSFNNGCILTNYLLDS